MIGRSIGPYEVVGKLGEGGMGLVYRARDSRLGRDVAIKVLPERVAADQGAIDRFDREGRALAALNHPHIATIHGLEEIPGEAGQPPVKALVLELVEGETLADRVARGAIPLDDALSIAGSIAEALAAAHERGIIHRDLKPANVKITPGGVVKVLDFGLAKILFDAAPDDSTMAIAATGVGAILGTPAYMAPEQAQGKPADARVDIWAFGALLYEMVTGERAFHGATVQDTLASVLTTDPDWARVPSSLQPLLRSCLERDPRKRLRDIGDYRFLIGIEAGRQSSSSANARRWWPVAATLAFVAAVVAAVMGWLRPHGVAPAEPVRLTAMLPAGVSATRGPGFGSSLALSPDGRTLIIAGSSKEGRRLYRRQLDRDEFTPVVGTDRGSSPFVSADGAWIGFFADGRLKRVPSAGGAAVDIAALPGFPAGAAWGRGNRIIYGSGNDPILREIDPSGGTSERIAGTENGDRPALSTDEHSLLFDAEGWIHALDRSTGQRTRLVQGLAPAHAIGRLLFSRGQTLLASPYDPDQAKSIVPVVEGIAFEPTMGGGTRHYAISPTGTLAYLPAADSYSLVVIAADGSERIIVDAERSLENPRFSRDGRQVVVATTRRDDAPADLWLHDLVTGSAARLTFDGGRAPFWKHDGTITYSRLGKGGGIFSNNQDGSGVVKPLVPLSTAHWVVGWTPDGQTLAYGVIRGAASSIVAVTADQSRDVVGPGAIWGGRLSHDGQWLAYYSLESGNFEVYVTRFPGGGARWLIGDGTDPAWSPDGNEVYYRSAGRLMAARVDRTTGVRALSQRVVIEPFLPPLYDDFDIHRDGKTLVVVRPANRTHGREVRIVVNWFSELRRLLDGR